MLSRAVVLVASLAALLVLPGCPDGGDAAGGGGGGGDVAADTGPDGGGAPCVPSCDWRECGPDPACGTSCGACTGNEVCDKGSCIPPGCTPDCDPVECGRDPVCGSYCGDCPAGETCEAGACVEGTCTPQCGRRECGPDPACLSSCGTCAAGEHCQDGTCVEGECQRQCEGLECGPDLRCGLSCGTCAEGTCEAGHCVLEPDCCADVECGPSPVAGCAGQSCGTCEANEECTEGVCVCIPLDCTVRQCGDDGCGASCGTCPAGCTCSAQGHCLCDEPCCEERECGLDPCTGGSCGTCGEGEECSDGGQCIPIGCEPQCGARECGPDPLCGDDCGTCDPGCACSADGQCLCGLEGACANDQDLPILNEADEVALIQQCVLNSECPLAECYSDCFEQELLISEACADCYGTLAACGVEHCIQRCLADQGGVDCLACLDEWCLTGFERCAGIELQPCTPDCDGRACGPDPVCGLSCGRCPVGEHCEAGDCVAGPCAPDCTSVECGPDPVCGVPCGPCPQGERCQTGQCVPIGPAGDACANAPDLAILNTVDAQAVAETCVLEAGCGTDEACLSACVVQETGVSEGCADCYGGLAACGIQSCLLDCYNDPGGEICLACLDANCMAAFEACSGITWEGGGTCTPQCADRDCGPDGCGGTCGTCDFGERCQEGQCVAQPEDACANAADLAILPTLDFEGLVTTCLLNCWTDQACLTGCVAQETGLSDGCSSCLGAAGVCVAETCLDVCLQDPTGQACLECAMDSCGAAFEACSGVPLPVMPL